MPITDGYDVIIIGKTPVALMTSINLSHKGQKVLILNINGFNKYPDYIITPIASLKAMNIPYDNYKETISVKNKINYIEREFNLSRFHIFDNHSFKTDLDSKSKNKKMFFDTRDLVSINTGKFIDYLTTVSSKMKVEIQKIGSYDVFSSENQNRISIVTESGQKAMIKGKICNVITTSSETNQAYAHQSLFISKILTDGLDLFITYNTFPSGYIFVMPTKNGSVINFVGKNISDDIVDLEMIQIINSVYDFDIQSDIKNKKKHFIHLLNQNQPIYSDGMYKIGSSLSIAHPITFGYFSGELQTGLAFTDAYFETTANNQKFDNKKIKSEYLKRLFELSFISEINHEAGKAFYNLSIKDLDFLMNLLHFTDLSNLSRLQKLKFRLKLEITIKLRKKRKLLNLIYESYLISRMWY